jgi:hypothetical protein
MRGVLSRIPVKKQKPIAKGLLALALFVSLYAILFIMWYAETTKTSGWLWWQETIETPLNERLPRLFIAIGLLIVGVVSTIVAVRLLVMQGGLTKYLPILTGVESMPIQRIADITNSTTRKVYRDVQVMINSGMISDFYIDYKAEEVVSKKYVPRSSHKTVATCAGCGGNTEVIVGIPKPCSFCGEPLVLKRR